MTVTASGTSGLKPAVQIFISIDDNWTGGQGNLQLDHQVSGNTSMFNLTEPSEILYVENEDMAAWGSVVLASTENNASFLTYKSGSTSTLYSEFVNDGELRGETLPYQAGDSLAFAHDLVKVSGSASVAFAVGQYRSHVISYLGTDQTGYHRSKYANVHDVVDGFLTDYEDAFQESQSLDKQIQRASRVISSQYSDLTSASVRQM